MIRSATVASLTILLCSTLACNSAKTPGTTPPGEVTANDGTPSEGDKPVGGVVAESGDSTEANTEAKKPAGEDPTVKVCEAEVAEFPTAAFAESMLIRLPKGLDGDKLVESTPAFLTARSFESVSCVENFAGAEVKFTAMGYFQEDAKKEMVAYRDEILGQLGYVGNLGFEEQVINGRNLEVAVDVPPDDKHPEPARVWMAIKAKFGRLYFVAYQVHPLAWNAIKKTLKSSTDRMVLIKKD